ncbi:MAG TPA: hypothetical protein DCG57_01730 [Candidatus Riflebacteria bacterium]|nr:hypothetical protein [Candidatus Riflebacteria bacterium]
MLPKDYVEFARDADLLFHDAQYTEEDMVKTRSWGHSTYAEALDLAIRANVKKLGLFHHDPDRTDNEIDQMVSELQAKAATRSSQLEVFAVYEGMQIELE